MFLIYPQRIGLHGSHLLVVCNIKLVMSLLFVSTGALCDSGLLFSLWCLIMIIYVCMKGGSSGMLNVLCWSEA